MSKPIIEVEHLSKCYRIGAMREPYLSLREEISKNTRRISLAFSRAFRNGQAGTSRSETNFWALNDVNFSVQEGEAVGIIGRNGAGKSTLLKILSQITPPTKGQITMRGRVASLLEVGTGFHPELTGRENIFLNGAILGMNRAEIRRKFDEIVAFSEVEKFLDTPVKRYSSGMYVRLAFAVAAHLEPEILIIDEVLAVGDAQFQQKCLGKMGEVSHEGRTVLFVSHNMAAVQQLCKQGTVLENGVINFFGAAEEAISYYVASQNISVPADLDTSNHVFRIAGATPLIRRITLSSIDNSPRNTFTIGEPIVFTVVIESPRELQGVIVGLHVYNFMAQRVVTFHTRDQLKETVNVSGSVIFSCLWDKCNLMPGKYTLVASFVSADGLEDRIEPALSFMVTEADFFRTGRIPPRRDGYFLPSCQWKVINNK